MFFLSILINKYDAYPWKIIHVLEMKEHDKLTQPMHEHETKQKKYKRVGRSFEP